MKAAIALIYTLTVLAPLEVSIAANGKTPIPASCPVTRSTPETRFMPARPTHAVDPSATMFWYGSDSLYTTLFSDGRWRGITSTKGARNKSFWFRENAEWLMEEPYLLKVTYRRFGEMGPMFTVPRVTNAIMEKEVAMLTMLELPSRGCWEVTANYKNAYVSFVTWVD